MNDDPREYPSRPWVGVGVIVWRTSAALGDEILLIKRAKPPREGEWSIPGGAVELGETVFAAAAREVREETGIDIRPLGIITVVDAITFDDAPDGKNGRIRFHYTLVEIGAEYASGDLRAADDACACRWVSVNEAISLVAWEKTRTLLGTAAVWRNRPAETSERHICF